MLTLKDFDYMLPKEQIAPYPTPVRSGARLLVVDRKIGTFEHRIFRDIVEYLQPGDLLVLNNTKVLPARLFGRKETGGKVEVLLLEPAVDVGAGPRARPSEKRGAYREAPLHWKILVRPSGRIRKKARILFGENGVRLEGEILDEPDGETGIRNIRFNVGARNAVPLQSVLNQIGRIPLPPYIDRPDEEIDRELYQTVFAEKEGAVAAPTAGLHFDEALLEALQQKGVEICFVTLHVSYGTFQPVQTEDLSKHQMYEEEFEIAAKAAKQLERALKEKRRIVACGTTVVRVLETVEARHAVPLQPLKGTTRLFIYPPYEFKIVDAMITNFHLPKSTLLMLVSAFAERPEKLPSAMSGQSCGRECGFTGRDLIFRAYEEAIRERYRFYSYGDAMLIL